MSYSDCFCALVKIDSLAVTIRYSEWLRGEQMLPFKLVVVTPVIMGVKLYIINLGFIRSYKSTELRQPKC